MSGDPPGARREGGPLLPAEGGWQGVAPSALPYASGFASPHQLDVGEVDGIVASFVAAARRAVASGFQVIEIHMAHGYLLHSFLSRPPLQSA